LRLTSFSGETDATMTAPMSFDDDRPDDGRRSGGDRTTGNNAARPFLALVAAGSLLGAAFAGVSTSDFIRHLDRQVHSIHCSFIPGAGASIGESGCRMVMLSPYSSVWREWLWGGVPISLLALAVFAYLVMHAARLLLSPQAFTKRDSGYLVAAAALPVVMSGIYGFIAVSTIGAVCKLCVGVYAASGVLFVAALLAHAKAAPARVPRGMPLPMGRYVRWFGEGVLYVAVLSICYVMSAPTSPKPLAGCGTLVKKGDSGIMIPMGQGRGGTPAIAVLDPLCPACKGFDERMRASDLYTRLRLEAVLFPLDNACNWMVKESLHPGACAVSEAMLCQKAGAEAILEWAFGNQEELRDIASKGDDQVRRRIEKEFPAVKGCLGSVGIRNRLNRSLRWAVANALPVLTPQLFIGDKRVCDEDTDLGLEYTIASMLSGGKRS
jgi:uncharacterized membrane protein